MTDQLAVVGGVAAAVKGGDARDIDDWLGLLPAPVPADLVRPLLESLVDGHEHEEVLWGIVHAAESVPTGPYERGLLGALPHLARVAPEWAEVLLLRCMNSETSLDALISSLPAAPRVERAAVRSVAGVVRHQRSKQVVAAAEAVTGAYDRSHE
jgi:hypothetical protein